MGKRKYGMYITDHCFELQTAKKTTAGAQQKLHYRIYPKYSDTSTPYHICSKIWASTVYYPMLCLKIAGWVANSVDPDEMLRSAGSHLGLNCLLRPVCPNTYGKYGIYHMSLTKPNGVFRPNVDTEGPVWASGYSPHGRRIIGNCRNLFVLRFYGPVNPMGSCRARSVSLTTRLLGRLSPLSG